jgi:predicted ATPase/DNA-binding winged helix-turn-helix (wHTH) protein
MPTDRPDAQGVARILFGPFELNAVERTLKKGDEIIPLGARAFDILVTLLDRPGEIIGKQELIGRVWPDVSVEEGSLRVHLSALRKALSDRQFGAKYIANVQGRGYSFVAPIAHQRAEVQGKSSFASGSALPITPSGMIGRDDTVFQISKRLRTERAITIVGTGGIGKTTVALAVGHAVSDDFSGSVVFVDLSVLKSTDQIAAAIATAVGLALPPTNLEGALLEFLRLRRTLLILDNCEHLVEQAAEIVDRIFQCAAEVRVLSTSREALQIASEHVVRLQPLDCPPARSGQTLEEILSYPAPRLFIERLSAQGIDLALGIEDAALVAEICRRLDGIALAIELVARRAASFGVRDTAARLESLNLLKLGRRTAIARHQTLRATLDWSYDLLSGVEQAVLRRMTILVGYFTLEAALAVAGQEDASDCGITEAIGGLVEKSLIVSRVDAGAMSYRLLDTTRSYGLEKLIASGEQGSTANRHAIYSAQLLEASSVDFSKADAPQNTQPKDYLGNVRAVLEWSFGPRGSDELATRLAAAAGSYFLAMSLLTECRHWMERALVRLTPDHDPRHQMEVHTSFALSLMFTEPNSELVRDAFDVALTLAEKQEDTSQQLRLLSGLLLYFQQVIDVTRSFDIALRAKAIADKTRKPEDAAIADCMLGPAYHQLGDPSRAQKHLERALGDQPGVRWSNTSRYMFDPVLTRASLYCNLFRSLWLTGDLDRAVGYADATSEEAERSGHPIASFRAHALATSLYFWIDDMQRAERNLAKLECNADRNSLGPYRAIAMGLRGIYFLHSGETAEGMAYLRTALKKLAQQRYRILVPDFAAELAVCLAKQDDRAEALALIEEVLADQQEVKFTIHLPALFLAKALVFTHGEAPDDRSAEGYFEESLVLARDQSALSYELRAGLGLARLWSRNGELQRARDLISPIYSRFAEGFGTPDLIAAREVLGIE